jgi:protein gp37
VSEQTGISWAHHTHNLWWGCQEVSEACDHCYAKTLATRYGFDVWGLDKPRRMFREPHYNEPLGWNAKAERAGERRRVFINSMSDIGEQHPNPEIAEYLDTARHDYFTRIVPHTPWLDHLLLTKRPANYGAILPERWLREGCPPNVWLGITAENQQWLDIRVPSLLKIRARVHWISYEPALGSLDLRAYIGGSDTAIDDLSVEDAHCVRCGCVFDEYTTHECPPGFGPRIDWLIAGGESGPGHRQAELEWYRSAQRQCAAVGTAFWFKQHSGLHPKQLGDRLDGQRYHELPEAA